MIKNKKKAKSKTKYIMIAKPSKPSFSKKMIEKMMNNDKPKKAKKTMKKKTKKPNPELRYLMILLKYNDRNIKNDGTGMDDLFKSQHEKIKKQIEELG